MSRRGVIVGVDVGGTFTDLFLLDSGSGTFRTAKVPSRRGDEALGFLNGLRALGGAAGMQSIVHGTTVGTNTLLERRGPKIGVITTRGFRDMLEMRRRDRRRTWGLWGDFMPIADRDMRARGGRAHAGRRHDPHGGRSATRSARRRRRCCARGAQAVAITFINAYANAENERRALAAVREVWPNEFVTASHEVLSEIREFERSSTAALNAYLQPVVASYLGKLDAALAAQSFPGKLHIVQSNGGIMSTATARRLPVRTALSGPAAGVVAGAAHRQGRRLRQSHHLRSRRHLVRRLGDRRRQGRGRGADHGRFRPGDPHADDRDHHHRRGRRLDRLGRSRRAAAGRPGKRGLGAGPGLLRRGQHAADADRRAGRARPHQRAAPARRRIEIARRRGRAARHRRRMSASRSSLASDDAAAAIVRVAEARMAGAIRLVSIERGHDPARFVAMPFGGGGALHVGALIREIGLKSRAGAALPRHHLGARLRAGRPAPRHGADAQPDARRAGCRGAGAADAGGRPRGERGDRGGRHSGRARPTSIYELDMHYLGQTHTVSVPLPVAAGRRKPGRHRSA